jgi:2,4-didehydro-3-deoxy-L-rhamnonate hydrolase
MALNVLHFKHHGRTQWGVIRKGRITPVPGEFAATAAFLVANPVEHLATLSGSEIPEVEVELLSPVTRNQQFICQGANYRQHMIESGLNPDEKKYNMIFVKAPSCIVPADSALVRPREVRFLDYEIELGLGRKCDITSPRSITEANLHEYVAGAVIVNDYSARDIQIPQSQFYKGKSFRTFGPVGPYLCLLERGDIPKLRSLELTLTVNGTVRQKDSTSNLVYGTAETLSELSGIQDLHTGDLLATGTPSGCALSIPSAEKQRAVAALPEDAKWKAFLDIQAARTQYLEAGDLVESRIASPDGLIDLGVQRNRVVDEAT